MDDHILWLRYFSTVQSCGPDDRHFHPQNPAASMAKTSPQIEKSSSTHRQNLAYCFKNTKPYPVSMKPSVTASLTLCIHTVWSWVFLGWSFFHYGRNSFKLWISCPLLTLAISSTRVSFWQYNASYHVCMNVFCKILYKYSIFNDPFISLSCSRTTEIWHNLYTSCCEALSTI